MAALFISYAREDRDFVTRLAPVLEAAGHSLWWDDNLETGAEFRKSIEEALDGADAAIVVWSARSRMSRWVNDEAEAALAQAKLVPIRIDGCRIPLGFSGLHTIDLRAWDGAIDAPSIQALLARLADIGPAGEARPRPAIPTILTGLVVSAAFAAVVSLAWITLLFPNWWTLGAPPASAWAEAFVASAASALPVSLWAAFRARRFAQASLAAVLGRSLKTYGASAVIAVIVVLLAVAASSDANLTLAGQIRELSSAAIAGTLLLGAVFAAASAAVFAGARLSLRS